MYDKLLSSRSKKGFTLVEMLIVVAIIAILIAIAIPVFNAQLEDTRRAVDDGNLRSAESLAVATAMLSDGVFGTADTAKFYAAIDKETHGLEVQTTEPTGDDAEYAKASENSGKIIAVTVNKEYEIVSAGWE